MQTLLVRGGETGAKLARNLYGFIGRQATDAPQERRQFFAFDELHREKVLAVYFADVINATDVAVRDLTRHAHLSMEARERSAVRRECFRQKLQSDGLTELEIVSAVDFAHAAATEQTDDAVASGQRRAGREPRVVNRIKRGGGAQEFASALRALRLLWRRLLPREQRVRVRIAKRVPQEGQARFFRFFLALGALGLGGGLYHLQARG